MGVCTHLHIFRGESSWGLGRGWTLTKLAGAGRTSETSGHRAGFTDISVEQLQLVPLALTVTRNWPTMASTLPIGASAPGSPLVVRTPVCII